MGSAWGYTVKPLGKRSYCRRWLPCCRSSIVWGRGSCAPGSARQDPQGCLHPCSTDGFCLGFSWVSHVPTPLSISHHPWLCLCICSRQQRSSLTFCPHEVYHNNQPGGGCSCGILDALGCPLWYPCYALVIQRVLKWVQRITGVKTRASDGNQFF